jgi:DNA-binding NarL/FixJ family response regulator
MKFLIVDDHALIREAMRGVLLGLRSDSSVLEAADAQTALQTLQRHPDTDLVLLDLHLPDLDGLQVLSLVARRHPAVAVVMLSGDKDQATMRKALELGAPPPTAPAPTAPAPAVASLPIPPDAASLGLTDRQLEVLGLLMQGKNNKLICRALDLAEPTVKNHVSAILKALGVSSRTEAVLAVTRLGLTLPPVG